MNLIKIALVPDMGVAMVINSLLVSEGCNVLETNAGHLTHIGANQNCTITVEDIDADKAVAILRQQGFENFLLPLGD